ncbi:hydroxypyruvate isomerase [Rhodoferax koreense]|uniref:Hydroxypyruvate isomerase n=1 Tax=Rhodoferax koreensis TaxID=1842727 RepID=A0A1P8K2W3_9BURK|nr:2-oxo-tetronate isomerase [Rhodoferax koreense]APW40342.1 hydroxypyruvate isomerase [Rhodoferax koreense]
MPRFAANLSMMYNDVPFLDRFEAAAKDGFKAVEFLFPYAWPAEDIAARLQHHGLELALFNMPPGGTDAASIDKAWNSGVRGTTALPGHEAEFRQGVALALAYQRLLKSPRIHLMAGLIGAEPEMMRATYIANLRWAAAEAAQQGVDVLIEPINTRDIPGFFLNRQDQAHLIVHEVGAANLKVQMDLYHCQIVEGDVAMKIRQYVPTGHVGHIQIAGVPERHEPDTGEVHYPYLFDVLDEVGYTGWIGCEYRPRRGGEPGGTSAGLGWVQPYLKRP